MNNKKKLTIVIPDIDPFIFENKIIDGIPMINKVIKYKTSYDFWNEVDNKKIDISYNNQ
jgi:hypothetical protein